MYGLTRDTVPVPLHMLMASLGIDDVRNAHLLEWFDRNWLTMAVRNSMPHGLWAFAAGAFMVLSTLTFSPRVRQCYMFSVYLLIVALETLVGVFDVIDLVVATALYWFGIWITNSTRGYRYVPNAPGSARCV